VYLYKSQESINDASIKGMNEAYDGVLALRRNKSEGIDSMIQHYLENKQITLIWAFVYENKNQ